MFSAPMLAQIIRFYGHAMQGMMGSYLEKNLQALADVQTRFAEQTKGLYEKSGQTPEAWTQILSGQGPVMQKLMGTYLEQSKSMFAQMQEQIAKQTATVLQGLPKVGPPKR